MTKVRINARKKERDRQRQTDGQVELRPFVQYWCVLLADV